MLFQLLFICGSVFLVKGQTTLTLAGNGATSSQGRVEVTWNNIKGTVCKNNFTDLSASVVCRQLNFTNGGVAVTDGRFGAGTGTILLDNVNCNGTEQDILECSYDNQTNCVHSDDIGVICNGTTSVPITVQPSNCTPDNLDIRLVGPANLIGVGYVEVRRNGVWGSVCDDLWGKQDAQVVCRMLCYDPNNAQAGAPIDIDHAKDQVSTTYHLDDVECIGTETNITNCTQSDGNHNCDAVQQEFASVTCVPLINTRLTAPIPDLNCAGGNFNIQFSRIQDPNLDEKHLTIYHPYNGPCNKAKQTSSNIITFTIAFNGCGTINRTSNATHIIYLNTIKYDYTLVQDVSGVQIVRVNTYKVEVCCIFPRELEINKGFTPLPESIKKKAPGNFSIIMTLYNDSFITSLNQPVELILGQWLNVALKLEDTEGHPDLKLIVPDCKATPSDKPNDPIYFTLFSDKCAVDPTLGFFPLNSTTFGFRYQTFKFYEYANIYIHCNAWVCLTTEKNHDCDRTCNTTNPIGRRKRDASSRDVYQLLSQPLNFKQQEENSLIDRGGGWQVDLATTQRPSTLSATSAINIRSTKPSTPVSTVNPSGTTSKYIKVIDVGSLTTDASIVTESVTDENAPKTSPDIKSQTTVQGPASLTTKQTVSVSPTARNGLTSTIPNNDQGKTSLSSSPSHNRFKFASSTVKWHTTATTKQMVSGLPTSSNGFNLTTINQTNQTNVKTKTSTFSPSNSPTKMDSYVTTQIKVTPNNFKHAHDPNKLYFGGLGGKFILMSDASRLHVSTNAVISAIVCWLLLV